MAFITITLLIGGGVRSLKKICCNRLPYTPVIMFIGFFIGLLDNSDDTVQVDNGEICAYQWLTPVEALNKQKNGEISLPPPTYVTLSLLSDCKSIDEALRHTDDSPKVFRPRIAAYEGGFCSVYEDDAAYESLDLDKPGKRHRLYVRDGRFDYINE